MAPTNGSMAKESEKCGLAGRFNIRQSKKWADDRTPNDRLGSFFADLSGSSNGDGEKVGRAMTW